MNRLVRTRYSGCSPASIAVCIGAVVGNGGLKTRRNVAAAPATDRELFLFGIILAIATILVIASNVAFVAGASVSFADVFDIEKLARWL